MKIYKFCKNDFIENKLFELNHYENDKLKFYKYLDFYKHQPKEKIYEIDLMTGFYTLLEDFFDGPDSNSLLENCNEYIKYYNSILDEKIETVILDIDRGINNFEWFGSVLKCKFPNVKYLFITQTYSHSHGCDSWNTFENLFINLNLNVLMLSDMYTESTRIFNNHQIQIHNYDD